MLKFIMHKQFWYTFIVDHYHPISAGSLLGSEPNLGPNLEITQSLLVKIDNITSSPESILIHAYKKKSGFLDFMVVTLISYTHMAIYCLGFFFFDEWPWLVLFSDTNEETRQNNAFFYLWIVSAVISSCYTFTWDIKMDWGLFDDNAGDNKFLREEIVYAYKVWLTFSLEAAHACSNFFFSVAWI